MPSLAKRIFQERAAHGGWFDVRGNHRRVVVLGGIYAGTWNIGILHFGMKVGLWRCGFDTGRKSSPGYETGPWRELRDGSLWHPSIPLWDARDRLLAEATGSTGTLGEMVDEAVYIVACLAEVDHGWMSERLTEFPSRRDLVVRVAREMMMQVTSHDERRAIARRCVMTWSLRRSLPAYARRLKDNPGWYPMICKFGRYMPENWHERPNFLHTVLHELASDLRYWRVVDVRDLLREVIRSKQTLAAEWRVIDTVRFITQIRQYLKNGYDPSPERRRAVGWVVDGRWTRCLRSGAHDELSYVVLEAQQYANAALRVESEEWNRSFADLGVQLPDGVRQLTVFHEFVAEGREMSHCVGTFALSTKGWCFSITSPSGQRSTLQIVDGFIRQHFGVSNTQPPPACVEIVEPFCRAVRGAMREHPRFSGLFSGDT